jgi:hypothetical protein
MIKPVGAGKKDTTDAITKDETSTHAPTLSKNVSIRIKHYLSLLRRGSCWCSMIGLTSIGVTRLEKMLHNHLIVGSDFLSDVLGMLHTPSVPVYKSGVYF